MLPDFPQVKAAARKHQMQQFHAARAQARGPFADVREDPLQEGHRSAIIREDGTVDEMRFKKIAVSRTVKMSDMEKWSEKQIAQYHADMAREIAMKQNQMTYEGINEAVAKVGNEIVEEGVPTAETLLSAMEKMWIDFNEDGTHVPLTFVSGPELQAAYANAFKSLQDDPVIKKRYDEVMERKRLQWREREGSRKLVG